MWAELGNVITGALERILAWEKITKLVYAFGGGWTAVAAIAVVVIPASTIVIILLIVALLSKKSDNQTKIAIAQINQKKLPGENGHGDTN